MNLNQTKEQYLEQLSLLNQAMNDKNLVQFKESLPYIETYLKNNTDSQLPKPELYHLFTGDWVNASFFIYHYFVESFYPYMNKNEINNDLSAFIFYNNTHSMFVVDDERDYIMGNLLEKQDFSDKKIRDRLLNHLYDSSSSEYLSYLSFFPEFKSEVGYYQCSLWHIIAHYDFKFFKQLFSDSDEYLKKALTENNHYGRSFVDFAYYSNIDSDFFKVLVQCGGKFTDKEFLEIQENPEFLSGNSKIEFYNQYLIEEEKKYLDNLIAQAPTEKKFKI
jgi:hypothetical protein